MNGQTISEKLPVHGFEWRKYKFTFKKNSHKTMTKTVIKDISLNDTQYSQKLHELHSKLPFFKERIKIKNCEKVVCMLYHKKNTYFYVIQIKALKKALDHGFKLNKVHKYSSLI